MVILEVLETLAIASLVVVGLYYRTKYNRYKRFYKNSLKPKQPEPSPAKEARERWLEVRSQILLRDHFRCRECGYYKHLEVHHIIPKSKGGTDDPKNLVTLCQRCHDKKHGIVRQKRENKRRRHNRRNHRKKLKRYLKKHARDLPKYPVQSLEDVHPRKEDLSPNAVKRRQELYKKWEHNELNQPA
jgi:hypothetical protein